MKNKLFSQSLPSTLSVDSDSNFGTVVGENSGSIVNITFDTPRKKTFPSLLTEIIEKLIPISFNDDITLNSLPEYKSYNIDQKIEYNKVLKYKPLINEYSIYSPLCDDILNIVDNNNFGTKTRILRFIKTSYLEFKGEFLLQNKDSKLTELEIIQNSADALIDSVKDKLFNIINDSLENNNSFFLEDIHTALICFVCYCFIECKILEEPTWLLIQIETLLSLYIT